MTRRPRLLVLEPYYGGSHRAFLDVLLDGLDWEADVLTLPPRKWKWRMSGAAITMADEAMALAARGGTWDAVLASTFVNLAEFKGLSGPAVAGVPCVVYFHENQLAYPNRYSEEWDYQFPLINVKSALAADTCVFNSAFNMRTFLEGIPGFLKRFPDSLPQGTPARIAAKSQVLPPPFDPRAFDAEPIGRGQRPRVAWPHRWDHDKAPEVFFAAVERLAGEGIDFEVVVAGEAHRDARPRFERLSAALGDRLVAMGGLDTREAFAAMLRTCDISVSTAAHEFFGLAMVESAYAGCFPLVPDRLAYPEIYPAECRYAPDGELTERLRRLLTDARPDPGAMRAVGERYIAAALMPRYEQLFARAAATDPRRLDRDAPASLMEPGRTGRARLPRGTGT